MNTKKLSVLLQRIKLDKIAVQWFVSYCALIIVVLIVILVSSLYNMHSVIEQTDRYAVSVMNNKKQSADYIFNNVENVAVQLSMESDISDFAKKNETEVNVDILFELFSLRKYFLTYSSIEKSINNVFIYFYNVDYIMGMQSGNDSKNYFLSNYSEYGISYDEWQNMMTQKHAGKYIYLKDPSDTRNGNNILCLYSIQNNTFDRCIATIGIELSLQEYFRLDEDMFFALDNNTEIIFSNANEQWNEEIKKYVTGTDTQVNHKKIFGEKFAVLQSPRNESKRTYVLLTNEKSFLDKIKASNRTILLCFLLSIMLGVAVAFILTKRNYRPIKRLFKNIMWETDKFSSKSVEEAFNYLQEEITDIFNENNELRSKGLIQDAVFKNIVAVKMLKNENIGELPANKVLENMGMKFKYDYFIVVLWCPVESNSADGNENMITFLVSNILEEYLNRSYSFMKFELEYEFGYIINAQWAGELENIEKILRDVYDRTNSEHNALFYAAVSNEHDSIDEIPLCYSEAEESMRYLLLKGEPIMLFRNEGIDKGLEYVYTLEQERVLIGYLEEGNADESKRMVNKLFEDNLKVDNEILMQFFLCDLIGTLAKLFAKAEDTEMLKQLDMFFERRKRKNIQNMKNEIISAIDEFCRKHGSVKLDIKACSVTKVTKKYIDENYNNPDIGREMIAEYVGISSSYLSTLFKKEMGIGLAEYIVNLRLKSAKTLLCTTNMSISDIANSVGYINARTFSRIFLKNVGIQPGQYRKFHTNQN